MEKNVINKVIATGLTFCTALSYAKESSSFYYYVGIGGNATCNREKFNMDFETSERRRQVAKNLNYKNNNIKRGAVDLFIGVKRLADNNYMALESGVSFSRPTLKNTFTDTESLERLNFDGGYPNVPFTTLACSYGTEYNLTFKFGRSFDLQNIDKLHVYALLGTSVRRAHIRYTYDWNATTGGSVPSWASSNYDVSFKRWCVGFVPGVGLEFDINKRFSIGFEYKYKIYGRMKKGKNLAAIAAANNFNGIGTDTKERIYKLSGSQHNLSLRIIVNI